MTEREQFEAVLPTLVGGTYITEVQKELMWMAWSERATAARQRVHPESSESAVDWIRRHHCEYPVASRCVGLDVNVVHFMWGTDLAYAILSAEYGDDGSESVTINLHTAEDCESLCQVLRVTPELTT